ncbi:MAG TPA: hypothetical protein VHC19_02705 [Pirellulales bacterium]|nr:hypothetical protein [Pirellulales bacterium]
MNDVVRYWRTMCVDFAYKEWEQAGGKWAIRNIKLRMSRKLLFVSALLAVFSCYKNASLKIKPGDAAQYVPVMQEHLMRFVQASPLNIIGWAFHGLGLHQHAGLMLDCYEAFLEKLDDETVRAHLGRVSPASIYHDREFLEIREISHQFQDALSKAFFEADSDLREFTIAYGVF